MKTIIKIVTVLITISSLGGCNNSTEPETKYDGTKPGPIIVAGKILNRQKKLDVVSVLVNDIALYQQLSFNDEINRTDSTFHIVFERYLPQDMFLQYGDALISFFASPGDSIFIELSADLLNNNEKFLRNIKFSGDKEEFNKLLTIYRANTYHNPEFVRWFYEFQNKNSPEIVIKMYDSIKQASYHYLTEFCKKYDPPDELKEFLKYDIKMDYTTGLSYYPVQYGISNGLVKFDFVSSSFYDFMKFPLPEVALINSQTFFFIGLYFSEYVYAHLWDKLKNEGKIFDTIKNGKQRFEFKVDIDSAKFAYAIQITKDPLLKQLVIAWYFAGELKNKDTEFFDSHKDTFDKYVTKPFLRGPLLEYYNKVKDDVKTELIKTDKGLKNPGEVLLNKILRENQGKVIYLDCWSTSCGPCIKELPASGELMKKFDKNKVAFVYLCMDSDSARWKKIVNEIVPEGKHYLSNKIESRYLYKILSVQQIPRYILINKEGKIVEEGRQLSPSFGKIEIKIRELLTDE